MVIKQEKITITIPSDVKAEVVKLKERLHVSMNSLYQKAIQDFVKQQKRERLRKEAQSMVEYYNSDSEVKDLTRRAEDIVEY